METTDTSTAIIKGLCYFILLWCLWLLFDMTFLRKPKKSCGWQDDNKEESFAMKFNYRNRSLFEKDVTPEQKACIAVGLCNDVETLGVKLKEEAKINWQNQIINGADKIFYNKKVEQKSNSQKPTSKKRGKKK